MKKLFIITLLFSSQLLFAQTSEFKIIKNNQATKVKNQAYSGTCWSFATTSFIESEMIKKTGKKYDLSEMFTVRQTYKRKAIANIRMQGYNYFTPGGQASNLFYVLRNFGAVPEVVYSGLKNNKLKHNHKLLDKAMSKIVSDTSYKGLSKLRINKIDSVLDFYLGKIPKSFYFEGEKHTPKSFFKKLKINPDDYIELTSYTHQPYYHKFCLRDKYNWASDLYLNIPLDELLYIAYSAINNGYTIDWNGDVSEPGFNFWKGTAVLQLNKKADIIQLRQNMYDNQSTTVDHLMHITGVALDNNGEKFFYVKNSWGKNKYGGYMYMSEDYFKLKTVSIIVNKKAVPKHIAKKIKQYF